MASAGFLFIFAHETDIYRVCVCMLFVFQCACMGDTLSQENVTLGAYSPVELSVKTKGQELNCRTYIMNSCVYAPPSPQYLQVRMLHPRYRSCWGRDSLQPVVNAKQVLQPSIEDASFKNGSQIYSFMF